MEPWSETWRHAVEAVAGRQAGAALATAPAPAATEPRPAAEPSTAQQLWSVLSNSVSNAATRIASKTLEVHSVDTYETHLRAYMAKRRASLEGSPAEAKIEF